MTPWDYALKNGMVKLFARSCCGLTERSSPDCQACQQLAKNETLQHIQLWTRKIIKIIDPFMEGVTYV